MVKTKTSVAVAAREKARAAKVALDAERAKHDKLVEEATTDYYVAVTLIEQAQADLEAATSGREEALVALVATGESNEAVVTLTGATVSEVRAARKVANAAAKSGDASGEGSAAEVDASPPDGHEQ